MALVRSLLFALLFYAGTVVAVTAGLLAAPFGQRGVIRVARDWARFHHMIARNVLGISVRIEGARPEAQALYAVKHESMFETLEALLLFDDPVVVLKRELAEIPMFGKVTRLHGVIPVDRGSGASAMRAMLAAAKRALASGRSVAIFPEGTRVPHGEVAPLRAGFAGLYRVLGLPVVPVATDTGRLMPRRGFVKRPGVVTFRFGDPIPPGLKREDIEARVLSAINVLNA